MGENITKKISNLKRVAFEKSPFELAGANIQKKY